MRRIDALVLAAACGAAFAGSAAVVVAVLPAPTVRTVAVEPAPPLPSPAAADRELRGHLAMVDYYARNNDRPVAP